MSIKHYYSCPHIFFQIEGLLCCNMNHCLQSKAAHHSSVTGLESQQILSVPTYCCKRSLRSYWEHGATFCHLKALQAKLWNILFIILLYTPAKSSFPLLHLETFNLPYGLSWSNFTINGNVGMQTFVTMSCSASYFLRLILIAFV